MLGELIDYLAPRIIAATNTVAMQELQGAVGSPTAVGLFDTRAGSADLETLSIPYVKIYITDELPKPINYGLSTGNNVRIDAQNIMVEAIAEGATRDQATSRTENLLLAIEGTVHRAKEGHPVFQMTDLGGTGSNNVISNWYLRPGRTYSVRGPGDNLVWTSLMSCMIEVWVEKNRK